MPCIEALLMRLCSRFYILVAAWPNKYTLYIVTLNLIPSFGACTRSCLVPRYRSVVCTEACPSSSWICSSSPPAARHIFAQVRRIVRRDSGHADHFGVLLEQLPDNLLAQDQGTNALATVNRAK